MPTTLFDQLTDAFRAKDPQTSRGLLERAAKQSADAMASGDQQRLTEFCGSLALVHLDTDGFELTPELRELRGYLAALVQLTRAALDHDGDPEPARKIEAVDYRPAILSCVKREGAARHDAIAEALGISPRALEQPIRSLLSTRTITATMIEDARCYVLTPLGFVVARRLEERAGGQQEPPAEAPSPERPVLFEPEALPQARAPVPHALVPGCHVARPPRPCPPEAAGMDTEQLPVVEPPEPAMATDELPAFDTDLEDAARAAEPAAVADEAVSSIALDIEESEAAADDATITEDILPEEELAADADDAAQPSAPEPAAAPQPVVRDTARTLARKRQHVKVRVAVLHGGISAERDVSLRSGEAVGASLRESGYQVVMIDVQEATLGELSRRWVDVAFIALRGTFGEDGGIQAVLDALGVPYTGSSLEASRLASDKIAAKKKWRVAGIPTPAFVEIEAEWPEPLKLRAAASLGFPAVLKPTSEGSSLGVAFVGSRDALPEALDEPFKFDTRAFAEQYIGGRELAVGILDGQPLPIIELVYDGPILTYALRQTPDAVTRVVEPELPAAIAAKVRTYALAASECLACRACTRVDLRLDADNTPQVLEVNTLPPLTPDSLLAEAAAAAGIGFRHLCEQLVASALPVAR